MKLIETLRSAHAEAHICANEHGEFEVRIPGQPAATYPSDSKRDAMEMAQQLLGQAEVSAALKQRA